MNKLIKTLAILTLAAMLPACGGNKQLSGAGIGTAAGAGLGAVIGQAIGQNTRGTVIGAGIGAVVGGVAGTWIGSYMDQQEKELRGLETAEVRRDRDVLTATFRSDLFFDFDRADLKPGASQELDRVAKVLTDFPETAIRVEGHTDAKGSVEYNQALSERRALSVKDALIQRNVAPQRIQAVGYGKSQIISSSDAVNRRVVIVINPVQEG
ncbi:MAG: OmpA family protein [Deltaproteobacteria bacterium]|nr:OmpA family protein [Deltaproteobacteria bacterium]